jgi:hypothetical protein
MEEIAGFEAVSYKTEPEKTMTAGHKRNIQR